MGADRRGSRILDCTNHGLRTVGARSVVVLVLGASVAVGTVPAGCTSEPPPSSDSAVASPEQLRDSKYCGGCHRAQYEEWAGSMHAYAADDPVFRALNRRMQREVLPEQQAFCLNCHAPMAVRLGAPTDVARLDETPELKGVTCFFCHAMTEVRGSTNNPLVLGDPPVLGGAIREPLDPVVHKGAYRTWLDGTQDNQSAMCGPCHDIVAVGGAHIERTFREWTQSRFGVGEQTKTSCAFCHMPGRDGPATVIANAPVRRVHDHSMVGVDLALTPFPEKDRQREKTQQFLDDAIDARLCVERQAAGGFDVDVALRNQRIGHGWPSGSNQDRRAWIELTAYVGEKVVFESGHIPDDVAVSRFPEPNLFVLRDHDFDAQGLETDLFWRAARFTSNQLPAAKTSDPRVDNSVHVKYLISAQADRVTMAVKIRPIDHDLLDELAASGDLDKTALDPIPTFTLQKTRHEWTAAHRDPCVE
jgi:nitrate/TMAO reductase-like tetraheme cytochrome c subunit